MATDRLSLLIADDDSAWRETVEELLSDSYSTVVVSSGAGALEVISAGEADFALCDIQMGDVTGLDVAEFVYSQELLIPCLLMTARPSDEVISRAKAIGVETVLSKPVGRIELVDCVSRVASRLSYDRGHSRSADLARTDPAPTDPTPTGL